MPCIANPASSRRAAPLLQLLAAVFIAFPAYGDDEAAARAAELEQVRERIGELRRALDRDLTRRDSARGLLRDAEQAVARQSRALRDVERRLADSRGRLDRLQGERARHERELDGEMDALAAQVRAAYALGRQERLKLLLNQEDPAALGRVLVYYGYLNRARIGRIDRVNELIDTIAGVERDIVAESEALAATRAEQRTLLDEFERNRERRAAVLAGIERELRTRDQQLQRLQADEERLAELLRSLTDLLADVPADIGSRMSFSQQRGSLDWPVRGSLAGQFGQPRPGGGPRWRGHLIGAPAGTEVRAVAYGRVAFAGWMPHFGNLIIIEHGEEYYTLYAHGRALFREAGEWVQEGDVIAEVGDSGGQPQPGLYFELRKGREILNPHPWLARQ